MKSTIGITIIMLCISCITFGQDYKNNVKSIKEVDLRIDKGQYSSDKSISADRLVIKTSEEGVLGENYSYSNEEWALIKKQILETKKRVIEGKEIFAYKVMDTILIALPIDDNELHQLSGW